MKNWWNEYVGLPYKFKGRTRDGLDCWGLVRLVHSEQFGVDLPSFAEYYESDKAQIEDLIAMNTEGWMLVDTPRAGDVVLFSIMGEQSHVGIITTPGFFLHVREDNDAVIDRCDHAAWKHRIRGIYRYAAGAKLSISACPHPLQTKRIDAEIPAGLTLQEITEYLRTVNNVSEVFPKEAIISVNGQIIPQANWATFRPEQGSRIEYRAVVRGSGIGAMIAIVAIMIIAWWAAPLIMGFAAGSAGWAAAAAAGSMMSTAMVAGGIAMAGSLLVNAIFPTRAAATATNTSTSPSSIDMLQGGSNNATPYSAIPVVLGRIRYTPPLGANTYSESFGNESYLRMMVIWGYGPLQVSDIRLGSTALEAYHEVEQLTINGEGDESAAVRDHFDSLYGKDVVQIAPAIELEHFMWPIDSSYQWPNGTVEVVTTKEHQFAVGHWARLFVVGGAFINGYITSILSDTRFLMAHSGAEGQLAYDYADAAGFTDRTLPAEVNSITLGIHFPQGLFGVHVKDGTILPRTFDARIWIKPTSGSDWWAAEENIPARSFKLPTAYYNVDDDGELEPVYRWTRVSLGKTNQLVLRHGAFTQNSAAEPSAALLQRLQNDTFGSNTVFTRIPPTGADEEDLYLICVHANYVMYVADIRGEQGVGGITGCNISYTGLSVDLSSGVIGRAQQLTTTITRSSKKAFTHTVNIKVPQGYYDVRIMRMNCYYDLDGGDQSYHAGYLQTITGFANNKPVNFPKPLCKTALRIMATNQLNGTVEGLSGTVQSICLDFDSATGTWIDRPTRNPASLYRYILQHPANAKPCTNGEINLVELADWHTYCRTNKFTFDMLHNKQRSLLDVMRDIAAAGRASPSRRDGVWSVIIDRPRTHIAQHFTPHNSWGFEATRVLPSMPHGFRVQFQNEQTGFQPDERIVYDDGYNVSNATLLEGLSLPGVTHPDIIFKHARFHLAQLKLRPENYTLNADIEHLVCTRGDLVRVTHDVPMWGLATGRLKKP